MAHHRSMTDESGYLLDNARAEAGARFAALSAIFDPPTFRRIDGFGIGPGWRCWEVGAGGPSVPRGLAERVGPTGRVLATDIDVSWTREAAGPVVEVRRHDVARDEPPGETFDLVHARLVLVHVADRERALRSMVAALKPGGRLLLEDADPALQPLSSPYEHGERERLANRIRTGFRAMLAERGADLAYGRRLPGWPTWRPRRTSRSPPAPATCWRRRPSPTSARAWSPAATRPGRRSSGTWPTSRPEAWTWRPRRWCRPGDAARSEPRHAVGRLRNGAAVTSEGWPMQFIETSVVGVRSAVITLANRMSPMRFRLFPMVHVGERSFYDQVTARLTKCAIIVAEGTPAGSAPVQERMSRIRFDGLVDQIGALDLESLGIPIFWEAVPRPPETRAERLRYTAEDSFGAVALRILGRYGDPLGLPSLDEADEHDDRWEGGRVERWMRERIVDRRDDALNRRLTSLHREHHARPITVAVVYGAGHMPAVVEHLREEFGYFVKGAEWLVVANAPG
jgi:SAM-dependent methyltransferase